MGRKISVDSATLMNKGLEVIEATLLFGLPESQVDVIVHPQSVVHSLVEYADGSMLAQLGAPDMRTPIAQALAWPERFASGVQSLDLAADRAARIRAAGSRAIPESGLGASGGACRRHGAGGAERGQRGRGAGVSRPALELYGDCRRSLTRCCSASIRRPSRLWAMFWTPTRRRGAWPKH